MVETTKTRTVTQTNASKLEELISKCKQSDKELDKFLRSIGKGMINKNNMELNHLIRYSETLLETYKTLAKEYKEK